MGINTYFYQNFTEMIAFIGEYLCRIDNKGRIMLPAAFKRQLPDEGSCRFVIKRDIYEPCLELYPMEEWERQQKLLLKNINPYDPEHRQFLRDFHAGAVEVTTDRTNRILLPARLIRQIGLESDVILLGGIGKIEIWDAKAYDTIGGTTEEKADRAKRIMQHATYNLDDL